MGAELGATTSIFPFDAPMDRVSARHRARRRSPTSPRRTARSLDGRPRGGEEPREVLRRGSSRSTSRRSSRTSSARTLPTSRARSRRWPRRSRRKGYPDAISAALIGSCTNSSYEDISRAADVAPAGEGARDLHRRSRSSSRPGSEQIRATIDRDGQLAELETIGATVLANACGPCIGQWKRDELKPGEKNSIVTSFNRNFPRRNDGNPETLAFIASPEIVIAYALAGRLSFNPLDRPDRRRPTARSSRCAPPTKAPDLPANGFVRDATGYLAPSADGSRVDLRVAPDSERLQLLAPFAPWDGKDFVELPLLLKAKGKCTTDHISPAGPWLTLPRPPRQHQRQHVHRRGQRLHGGAGHDAKPADRRGGTEGPGRRAGAQGGRRCAGSWSATRTTARDRAASTRRCRPATSAPPPSSSAPSPASTSRT